MVKNSKKTSKRAKRAPLTRAQLAEARAVAERIVGASKVGYLALVGMSDQPRDPSADVVIHDGRGAIIVWGISDKGKGWIARQSEGYEGAEEFGPGAHRIDREFVAPLKRGLDAAGLKITTLRKAVAP